MPKHQVTRISRLVRLISEIKSNPRQRPEQLWQTLGVSRAQYFQDKTLLEKTLDFHFHFDRGKGGYEIVHDPYLPLMDLQLSEVFALILSVRQLSASGDYVLTYQAVEGIRKIVGGCQPALRDFLQTVLDEIVLQQGFGCRPEILEDLRKACSDHRHLVISYHHYDEDAIKIHEIDPYQLFFKRRALYLDAYDKMARAFRVFRLNRIRQVNFTGMRGPLISDYSFAARFKDTFSVFAGNELKTVRIRFSQRIAPYIKESLWHTSQEIADLPDGGILYQVTVSYPKEVAWWAMQWMSEAEVLEPMELRAYVAGQVQKMVDTYADGPDG